MIELLIFDAILVTGGVLVLRSLRAEGRKSSATHPCHATEMRDMPSRRSAVSEFTLRLAFVEQADDAIVLDGVITDEGTTIGPAGWPITLRVCRPFESLVAGWMYGLLHQWATENALVRVKLRDDGPRSRVSITDGATTLHFDPAPVDGGQLRDA